MGSFGLQVCFAFFDDGNIVAMFGLQKKYDTKLRWHPDFRIVEKLPDTKMIRTKFIINLVGIGVFFFLFATVGSRELTKFGIRQSIATSEHEVESRLSSNRKLAGMSGQFRRLGIQLDDLKNFKSQPANPTRILVELARMRTPDVIFDDVSYDHAWDSVLKKEIYELRLKGSGRTTADIGELKNRLSIMEVADHYEIKVSEQGNPSKDPKTGFFSFVILLKILEVKDGTK